MQRRELESLRDLKLELNTLMSRYLSIPLSEEVGDTVKDYRTGKGIPVLLQGRSSHRHDRLEKKIDEKTEELRARIADLEVYLDSVEDSEMRDILRLYYAEGLSQDEIGRRRGYSRSAITRKIAKFFGEEQV